MTPQSSNIEFSQDHINKVFLALTSTDEELTKHFDKYIFEEYDDDFPNRLDYLDIAEIARFLIAKIQTGQTGFFQKFFTQVEVILSKCDSYVGEFIVIGLFESIQNNCGHKGIDYYQGFNKWLNPVSKQKWDDLIDGWEGKGWREKITNS
ncbi:MAG TPA: hypothetical protein VFO93_14575 [Hymenobacter sp.]|uniref:DUF7674 family protein n=1 Tax=Hymenobacter sp. TaxID=1898978 RepID=UPI002D7E713C|nr:hypothetical protein [Hymenobacter sp.]HET9504765.1 hypothetical protein [Hymenobacter sp.]